MLTPDSNLFCRLSQETNSRRKKMSMKKKDFNSSICEHTHFSFCINSSAGFAELYLFVLIKSFIKLNIHFRTFRSSEIVSLDLEPEDLSGKLCALSSLSGTYFIR